MVKDDYNEDTTSSSSDDDDNLEGNDELEIEFLRTLSNVKSKDPKIYNESTRFFQNIVIDPSNKAKNPKIDKPLYVNDYERKFLLEKGGVSDDEEEKPW